MSIINANRESYLSKPREKCKAIIMGINIMGMIKGPTQADNSGKALNPPPGTRRTHHPHNLQVVVVVVEEPVVAVNHIITSKFWKNKLTCRPRK